MVELLRAAVHYCYEQEKTAKSLTPKGYAGFTRIHHIWTEGIPDVPKLFIGSPIQDRDMARGTPDGDFPVQQRSFRQKPFRFRFMRKPAFCWMT